MIHIFFGLVTLAVWSNSDACTGKVHNLALSIPTILTAIFYPAQFIAVFIPMFVVLAALWVILRRRGLLGGADVIGIPFTLLFVTFLHIIAVVVFMGVFSALVLRLSAARPDRRLKRPIRDRIVLLPVLFLSFFVAVLSHLIAILFF